MWETVEHPPPAEDGPAGTIIAEESHNFTMSILIEFSSRFLRTNVQHSFVPILLYKSIL